MAQDTCLFDGCGSTGPFKRGWCNKHYLRWYRYGDPSAVRLVKGDTDGRFWAKINRNGPLPTFAPFLGQCWLWTGSLDGSGYGSFWDGGHVGAHRFCYERLVGPIPDGLVIDHLCRVRTCCNPGHLEPVTPGENALRGMTVTAANARKTHCKRGHPFDEENTYWTATGGRYCRACARGVGPNRKRMA